MDPKTPDTLTEDYWSRHYKENSTPWDMGSVSPPLSAFFQRLQNKEQEILIPGAGNAYEAEWLWHNGFVNTYVADTAKAPLQNLKARCPGFPDDHLLHGDFFGLQRKFDLVVEQTFFCALDPAWRERYSRKMQELIRPGGMLVGVLFDFPLDENGPPYGGHYEEYRHLFSRYFTIARLERCYNSIKPRAGRELFIHLIR